MKFLGEIKKEPCINIYEYLESIRSSDRIRLKSDFEIPGRFELFAVVYGKFDDSFCCRPGSMAQITENGNEIIEGDIELSFDLLDRLRADGETSEKNLKLLEAEL